MIHEARIVPLDDRAPLPQTLRAWTGYSRGRWDGDTLVLETSHFSDQANFLAPAGNRFLGGGSQLRLIERLSRIDVHTIDYRLTVEDPITWVRPWTVAFPLVKTDSRIYEYACHEGNYNMLHILKRSAFDDRQERRRRQTQVRCCAGRFFHIDSASSQKYRQRVVQEIRAVYER